MSEKQLPKATINKSAARLAAVQAIFTQHFSEEQKETPQLTLEMIQHYHGEGDDIQPDAKFLNLLVEGVRENQDEIDTLIKEHLGETWSMERIGTLMQSILRPAVFELLKLDEIPFKAIINEYVDIAHAFFEDDKEVAFVNGVLDRIREKVRE